MLTISQLATGVGPQAVAALFREARHRMPILHLSGVLLFDGERFAQWVRGPRAEVEALLGQTAGDKRQQGLRVLFEGFVADSRLPTGSPGQSPWLSGWAPPDSLAVLEMVALTETADVTLALHDLLPACDLL